MYQTNRNEYNVNRFFNQFISVIRRGVKNVGIITDKDGTLLLNDDLREALEKLKSSNLDIKIYLIVNSGRTVRDMINSLKEENIPLECFDYIIGDNGGMCIDVKKQEELFKYTLDKEAILLLIKQFINDGGSFSDIRMADGENIFAYKEEDIKKYYKERKNIIYIENYEEIIEEKDIIKITLTGTHQQIIKIDKYIREFLKGHKTHMGKTSFLANEEEGEKYRLDFTGEHTKGSASQKLIKTLDLDRCIFLGNDLNDISMFSTGLDRDDFIVIASSEYEGITDLVVKYMKEETKAKNKKWEDLKILVLEDNNVNKFLSRIALILNSMQNNKRKPKNEKFDKKYKIKTDTLDAIRESSKKGRKTNKPDKTPYYNY